MTRPSSKDFKNGSDLELHGLQVACLGAAGASDLVEATFESGNQDIKVISNTSHIGQPLTLELLARGCPPPNISAIDAEADPDDSGHDGQVSPIVLDDLATPWPADFWLHPCDCFPESLKHDALVDSQSSAAIPDDGNSFISLNHQLIVTGSFTCEQLSLITGMGGAVHILDSGSDERSCNFLCAQAEDCMFYWEGTVAVSKQCRLYLQFA